MTRFLPGQAAIHSFGGGGFRFAEYSHQGSLLILPGGMQAWRPLAVQDVSPADFEPAIQALQNFDMFLLGTGSATDRPPAKVMQHLNERNVPVEIMTTSSAVHVYNVVLAEGRRVAAALIVVV